MNQTAAQTINWLMTELRKAAGPDRLVDCTLHGLISGHRVFAHEGNEQVVAGIHGHAIDPPYATWWMDHPDSRVPHYTTSLTDALAFAEAQMPGFYFAFGRGRTQPTEPLHGFQMIRPDFNVVAEAEHEDPQRCILITALIARDCLTPGKPEILFHATPDPDACKHQWGGWRDFEDGCGGEQVCKLCGLGAMTYSLRTGP